VAQSYSASDNTPLTVAADSGLLVGATDADGDPVTVLSVTSPTAQGGTVTLSGAAGAFTYTPAANFNGQDTFSFTVGDGKGGTAIEQATITVGRLRGLSRMVIDNKAALATAAILHHAPQFPVLVTCANEQHRVASMQT